MISKISVLVALLLASLFLSSAALSKHGAPSSATDINLKPAERMPAECTRPINVRTGLCVCHLNFSNAPQFSFYSQAELNAGRQTCLAQFGSRNFILNSGSACDRFRQPAPNSQFVFLFWLLNEANRLIRLCAPPGVPLLRLP